MAKNAPTEEKMLIVLSLIEIKQPNLEALCGLRTRILSYKFCKNRARTRPLLIIILVKFQFFQFFLGRKPPPLSRSRWNSAGRSVPAKFHLDRWNVSPLRGAKNPKFGPWVKAIPAELLFGQILPVIKSESNKSVLWRWSLFSFISFLYSYFLDYYPRRLCRSAWVGFSSPSVCLSLCPFVCLIAA